MSAGHNVIEAAHEAAHESGLLALRAHITHLERGPNQRSLL